MVEAYSSGDAHAAAELYVEEAVQQPPGRAPVVGRSAIHQAYQALFAHGGVSVDLDPWETVVSGTEARERGGYRLASGGMTLLAGKYVTVATQTAGDEWRYVWTTVTPD